MAFQIKQGDRRPLFVVVLKDNFGEPSEAPVNLTTIVSGTAVFNMRGPAPGTAVVINRGSAAITSAAAGEVTYNWGTAVLEVGTYQAEIEITWADGKAETFPNDSYWEVVVTEDIA